MKRWSAPLASLSTGAAVVLGSHPALAHGTAGGGLLAGLSHPLLGMDHLLLLLAVGSAAAVISPRLLLWGLGGACLGAVCGSRGWSLEAAEVLASGAVMAVALVTLQACRSERPPNREGLHPLGGSVVAAGAAIHAMLHGLEAPQDGQSLLWWSGAALSSVLVSGSAYLLSRILPAPLIRTAVTAVLGLGGLLVLGTLGLITVGSAG